MTTTTDTGLTSTLFWKATAERAIKTAAQALLAVLGVGLTGLLDVDWTAAGSAAGLAAILSVLTSIASAGATGGGPSAVNVEVLNGRPNVTTTTAE